MVRLALAQQDFLVGDVPGNLAKIRDCAGRARQAGASLLLFPELALTGYPPEDLLLRPGFMRSTHEAVECLTSENHGIDLLVVWHAELATPGAWSELCVTYSSSVRMVLGPRILVIRL